MDDERMNYPEEPGWEKGSDTSKAAAKAMKGAAKTQEAAVYRLLAERKGYGATRGEIALALEPVLGPVQESTYSARIRELALGGHVVDSGKRRPTRPGTTKMATVWVLTKFGPKAPPILKPHQLVMWPASR